MKGKRWRVGQLNERMYTTEENREPIYAQSEYAEKTMTSCDGAKLNILTSQLKMSVSNAREAMSLAVRHLLIAPIWAKAIATGCFASYSAQRQRCSCHPAPIR